MSTPIHYRITASPLGALLVAATPQGICFVGLDDTPDAIRAAFLHDFPAAQPDDERTDLTDWTDTLLAYLRGDARDLLLPLAVQGTAFQQRVWQELQAIPYGETRTYGQIAVALGQPTATRAVGHACGSNAAALVIPCHRALRADGSLSGYRWGLHRKDALLTLERFGTTAG